jgi:hypothetical protein
VILALLLACRSPEAPTVPLTVSKRYGVTWTTVPTPVPLSELFTLEAVVTDAKTGAPVEDATVRINATMPQHGHGMATRPEDDPGVCGEGGCRHPGGVYRTRGMKFHMQGDWLLRIEVDGPKGADRLEAVLSVGGHGPPDARGP